MYRGKKNHIQLLDQHRSFTIFLLKEHWDNTEKKVELSGKSNSDEYFLKMMNILTPGDP